MKPIRRLSAIAVMLASAVAAPSFAQDKPAKPAKDGPDEVICEKVEVIGSRLSVKRVCMTRAQWAERRQLDRQELERVQTQRGFGRSE